MKHCHNLGLGPPIGDIVHDKLKMKERRWQVAFDG
jgi:hypothetical protein